MSHSNNRAHQKQQLSAFHPRLALPLALGLRAPRSIGEMKKLADTKNAKPAERRALQREIFEMSLLSTERIFMTLFGARFAKTNIKGESTKTSAFFRENSLFHQLSPLFARSAAEKTAQRLFYYERIKTNCTSVCVPQSLSRERERAEQSFLYSNSLHIITYNNFCAAAVVIITIKKAIVDTSRGFFGAADVRQMRPSSSF